MGQCLARTICPTCQGSGEYPHYCYPCVGTGEIVTHDSDGNEIAITCQTCGGTGTDYTCPACGGFGVI